MLKRLALLCLLGSSAWAQISILNPFGFPPFRTVATLPAASTSNKKVYGVTDGTSKSDCTTGGGSTYVLCVSNGTAWSPASGGAGGGGGDLTVQIGGVDVGTQPKLNIVNGGAISFSGSEDAGNTRNVITPLLTFPTETTFPAANCQSSVPVTGFAYKTSAFPAATCVDGSNTIFGVLAFNDTTEQAVYASLVLPVGWTGAIDAKLKWRAAATTGDVKWGVQTISVADAETADPSLNTASTVTDTAKGTTLQTNDATISNITCTGCAAGELLFLRIYRVAADGADTMTGDAQLISVTITTRKAI